MTIGSVEGSIMAAIMETHIVRKAGNELLPELIVMALV